MKDLSLFASDVLDELFIYFIVRGEFKSRFPIIAILDVLGLPQYERFLLASYSSYRYCLT